LNNTLVRGRKIEVRHDRGVETLSGKQTRIYVSQLPTECDEAGIREVFGRVGTIELLKLCNSTKSGTVWAILQYASAEEATAAVDTFHHAKFGPLETEIIVRLDRKVGKEKGA